MSLLGNIGRAVTTAAGQISRASSFVPVLSPLTAVTGIVSRLAPSTSPLKVPIPSFGPPSPLPTPSSPYPAQQAGMGGGIGVGFATFAACIAAGRTPAQCAALGLSAGTGFGFGPGTGMTTTGCGCGSRGRDPCTHQKMTHQPAPLATFFGGCCPPGRTLRRKPFGRDVCIKTPRLNPFNPHALARADRRITTFSRRAAPILHDMGYTVSRTRHVKLKTTHHKRKHR